MNALITKVKKDINPILKKRGVKRAAIFGSAVRGKLKKGSDIDVLVEITREMGLFDFVGLKLALEDILKRKVDLVEYQTIKPAIKKRILQEQVPIL